MRRLVVALIVACMLVTLVGCGGGDTTDEASSGEVAVQTNSEETAPSSGAGTDEEVVVDATPDIEQPFEAFPTDEEVLTSQIAERLDAHQPMMILFYDSAQQTSDDQRTAVDDVLADYRGLIELVTYDVGKYVDVDEDGSITVDTEMIDDETSQKVARLFSADYLGITFTPYLVFVNSDGYITYRYRGIVDSSLIEREVLRATD